MPFDNDPSEQLQSVLREHVEREVRGTFTSTIGIVRKLDDDNQRATVALKNEPNAKIPNVPIASTFARDGSGDVHPIEPGDEGMLLCPHDALEDMISQRGHTDDPNKSRHHALDDAVFMPVSIYYDEDDVPDHERGERVITHPSGATIKQRNDGGIEIDHPLGVNIELGGVPESDPPPKVQKWGEGYLESQTDMHMDEDDRDRTSFPPDNEGDHFVRINHDVGVEMTMTEHGVAITNGETDAGSEVRDVVSGQPNDGERIELDGHHQHRHVIPRPDGTYELTGPPLSFRQFMAQFEEHGPDVASLDCDEEAQAAREYAEAYKAWLEEKTNDAIDPTDEALWPTEEPMPTPDEKAEFDPDESDPDT